jgi:hypothetical protein
VLETLLSIANTWQELLIPCQNGSTDLKDYIMPFMMHSAKLPVKKGDFFGGVLPCPSPFARNEVSCSNTDFLYKYYDPGFQWNIILVLPIYQVNSVDHLTCTALVVGWLGFSSLNHCQGHLQTSRLL